MHSTVVSGLLALLVWSAAAYPSDPAKILAYSKQPDLIELQNQIRPSSPATLLGTKLTPNYLSSFLSLGTGQTLIDAQAKVVQSWNSSKSISQMIAADATQAPVKLPAKFKSGPLNEQLGELVVIYFAMWQGVETARRSYYRQVEVDQLTAVKAKGPSAVTDSPPFGKQFVPAKVRDDQYFINSWYQEDDPTVGNGVTAYAGTYLDLSKGPLLMSFPQITDFFLITFYNTYGEVAYTLGTRVGTKEAKKIVVVADADLDKVKGKFPASDIAVMPGYDGIVLSRILGPQRSKEYTIEPLLPGQSKVVSAYYWGTDPAMYYTYAPLDPLYFWKVAGLVLARNPRQGLNDKQRQLLKDYKFTDNGLEVDKLTADQKTALIAAIPIAAQGLAQSFYLIGPKDHGYWYTTTWNSIPGSYFQLNAAFFKGFWIANIIQNAAYIMAVVDSEGRPLNGRYDYTITFKEPPPSRGAFSSLQTMRFDQFAMADAIDAYNTRDIGYLGYVYGPAIASSLKATTATGEGWVRNSDGSWTVYLSSKQRPANLKGNYLRIAGEAPFYSVLRVYNPSEEVVRDEYAPPPLVRVEGAAGNSAVSTESGAKSSPK